MPAGSQYIPSDTTITERLSVGLAYSPNGEFLYVASMSNIYQYDLQDETWFHVAGLDTTYDKFQNYETAYLGPDDRIYIGNWGGGSKQMSRIDNPNVKGSGCDFCPRCLRLDTLSTSQGNFSVGTPPCMPNYSLGAKLCYPDMVDELDKEVEKIEVYPNPAFSKLRIKNGEWQTKALYNSVGQLMCTTTQNEMDVSSYPKGMYYVKVGIVTKKVILQ